MKKLLFVINTLGYGGAERALLSLLNALNPKEYQISLFVLTGQGELVHALPAYVETVNTDYRDCSVLTKEGRRHRLPSSTVKKGIFYDETPTLTRNCSCAAPCRMRCTRRICT